jgi:hypothetical protein
MQTIEIKYRTWFKGSPPQKIKLQVPGWAGDQGYSNGSKPQPWHCKPFVDGSTYGLELVYPFSNECVIRTNENEVVTFEGDFTDDEAYCGVKMPPFMSFAPHHYGFTSSLDIMTPPGIVTRIEPHPKFYTDRTGTVPIPVPGHIQSEWWSRIFFIAFKSPLPGQYHIFRPGEPYAQLLFVPKEINYDIKPMTAEEAAKRSVRDDNLGRHGHKLCTRHYNDHVAHRFDNKYKVMGKINDREGVEGVDRYIAETLAKKIAKPKKISGYRLKKTKDNTNP